MTNDTKSYVSDDSTRPETPRGGTFKMGAVAVASALLGGIAAVWWYRKTVMKLHETGESSNNPQFGIEANPTTPASDDDA
jgi:hypothetical protein